MPTITPLFEITITTQRDGAMKRYRVPAIESITVNTSRKPEPDTATIKISRMQNLNLDTLQQYDEVLIEMGHAEADYAPKPVFLGAISKIGPNFPLAIECKDWLWLIRKAWHKNAAAKMPVAPQWSRWNSPCQRS